MENLNLRELQVIKGHLDKCTTIDYGSFFYSAKDKIEKMISSKESEHPMKEKLMEDFEKIVDEMLLIRSIK